MSSPITKKLAITCRNHGVALVYLFGSQASTGAMLLKGEKVIVDDPLSDIDVGVITEAPLPNPYQRTIFYAALYNDMEDIFKPLRLDLVLLDENHSIFQLEAIKGICVFQSSQKKRDDYEMMILRRAADFRPFLNKYLREVLEEV